MEVLALRKKEVQAAMVEAHRHARSHEPGKTSTSSRHPQDRSGYGAGVKRLLKLLLLVGVVAAVAQLLRRRPAPPSASPTAPPEPVAAPRPAAPTEPWVEPATGGTCPPGYPVKAKLSTKIFHVQGGALYERTTPDRCYASPVAAEADGLRPSKR